MIDQKKVLKNYQTDDFFLIDVRTPFENSEGHIPGSINIPLDELPSNINELPKNKQIVTYCNYGSRSGVAEKFLKEKGFTADKLNGGLSSWRGEISSHKAS
ncbi:hypothetical protein GF376_00750 [Candidatus Peregrinibacteria bacterium]|nr:hypothetical protein [Candidatus Peregrinibacteria bacterium]